MQITDFSLWQASHLSGRSRPADAAWRDTRTRFVTAERKHEIKKTKYKNL